MRCPSVVILVLFLSGWTAYPGPAAAEPKKDVYIIPGAPLGDTSTSGIGTPQILDIMEKVFRAIEQKTGIELRYQEHDCRYGVEGGGPGVRDCSEVFSKLFRKGEADFSIMGPWEYVDGLEKGMPVKPLAALSMDSKKTFRYCLYVNSGVAGKAGTVKGMKGKTVAESCPAEGLQQILFENGIETPNDKFFANKIQTPLASALYSLVLKEADTVCMNDGYFKFSRSMDKRFSGISELYCTKESYGSSLIVYREGIDPGVLKRLKAVLLKMHKDKDFGEIKFLLIAVNGRFVEIEDSDYNSFRALLKRAREKGWTRK